MKYQFLFLLGVLGGITAFVGFALFIIQNTIPERMTFAITWWVVSLLMYSTALSVLMCDAQDNARIIRQNNLVDKYK